MKTKSFQTDAQAYCPPRIKSMELASEGVLCTSLTDSSADDVILGDELTDYEQIF